MGPEALTALGGVDGWQTLGELAALAKQEPAARAAAIEEKRKLIQGKLAQGKRLASAAKHAAVPPRDIAAFDEATWTAAR